MDHFGMDLTDLTQFCSTSVSEIKMDRTFLADLPGNEHDRAIVASVIGFVHNLGCRVTAQGVQSQEVADALLAAGCDEAQGYLWLAPSPWTDVARKFDARTTTAPRSGGAATDPTVQAPSAVVATSTGSSTAKNTSGTQKASR